MPDSGAPYATLDDLAGRTVRVRRSASYWASVEDDHPSIVFLYRMIERFGGGLPVSIADDPLTSVVMGTGKVLTDFSLLRKVALD